MQLILFLKHIFLWFCFVKTCSGFHCHHWVAYSNNLRQYFHHFHQKFQKVRISLSSSETQRSLHKLHVRLLWIQISISPTRLLVLISCEIISKFGRCRFVLFLRVEPVHQVSVTQRILKLQLLSLKISKRLSFKIKVFRQTPYTYMDCNDSFRSFFLGKKIFNLLWQNISTFEVLCIDFIKEIFIWVSLISCVRKTFVIEGIKMQIFKICLAQKHSKSSFHLTQKQHVEVSTKQACYKHIRQTRLIP